MEMGPDHEDVVLNASYNAFLAEAEEENNCDANDRDDLEEEEDHVDTTFHEKIQRDLQHLIDEIRLKANVTTQNLSIDPVNRGADEKEVILRN